MTQSVDALLSAHTVQEISVKKGVVVEVLSTDTLTHGFSLLVEHGILSAPVWDVENKTYTGFLDMRDLVSFAVFAHKERQTFETLQELVDHGAKATDQVSANLTVTYFSRRNPFKPVKSNATLKEVANRLASGMHRVPVVGDNGRVINVISQSTIVDFYYHHKRRRGGSDVQDEITDVLSKTVAEAHLGTAPVISVFEEQTALETFQKLDASGRSGIAVVNAANVLTGVTSSSDLKLYLRSRESLHLPIMDFLNRIRQMELKTRAPTFTCHETDTVGFAIGRLAATRAHRIFVVDSEHRPIRVISVTDVIRATTSK